MFVVLVEDKVSLPKDLLDNGAQRFVEFEEDVGAVLKDPVEDEVLRLVDAEDTEEEEGAVLEDPLRDRRQRFLDAEEDCVTEIVNDDRVVDIGVAEVKADVVELLKLEEVILVLRVVEEDVERVEDLMVDEELLAVEVLVDFIDDVLLTSASKSPRENAPTMR